MCGIYGIAALRGGTRLDPAMLARMAAVTVHRGPDDEGWYRHDELLLGMRRLSIIDVAGGRQPIGNEDGTVQVVCNGEIYNYRELADDLRRAGHRLATRSDTEVLVHLYEEHGDDLVTRLNGMFAFALWDARRRRLLVGRDRMGIKPLYYAEDGPRLLFASEAKAILAAVRAGAAIDPVALQEYLALGYVPAPYSLFRGIRKLPPGSLMVSEAGRVRIEPFWRVPAGGTTAMDDREWAALFVETLEGAVASQMVSDVPLGAFLSGGLDSGTIVALMARHSSAPVKTYSIGFAGVSGAEYYNELDGAARVARAFGTDHHEIFVKPDAASLLPKLIWHLDEPVADSAFITTYLVAELARRDVTVILSGVGGDELFGGYRRYLGAYYDAFYDALPTWLRRRVLEPLARALPSDRHSRVGNLTRQLRRYTATHGEPVEERYRSYVQVFARAAAASLLREPPADDYDALAAAFREVADPDPVSRIAKADLVTQLPDDLLLLTDRMTMATSLECRVPFLDNTVIDLSLRMPSSVKIRRGRLKSVMKQALVGVLPPEILGRPKRGFGAPIGAWFQGELAPLVRSILGRDVIDKRGLVRWDSVERTVALHETRQDDCTDQLLALTNLELWARIYLDGRTPDDVAGELAAMEAR
ncbi:MAG: asparagine synthase (glutamine-hydrolyzing) [Candidatus Rokuibacteriota bacterium]